jgi:hypothetical protein
VVTPAIIRSSYHCISSIWHYWDRTVTCLEREWMGTAGPIIVITRKRYCRYSDMSSWWWVELPPDTCTAVCNINKLYIVASCWTIIDIKKESFISTTIFHTLSGTIETVLLSVWNVTEWERVSHPCDHQKKTQWYELVMMGGVTTRYMYSSLQIQINCILLHFVGQFLTYKRKVLFQPPFFIPESGLKYNF